MRTFARGADDSYRNSFHEEFSRGVMFGRFSYRSYPGGASERARDISNPRFIPLQRDLPCRWGSEGARKFDISIEGVPHVMSQKRTRWITRTVIGIGLASFFSDLSHEVVTTVLPDYLRLFAGAAVALGTIEGVADGASMVAKLYGGWLADRLPRRKNLCASGYAVMAFSPMIIAAATHWVWVLVGRTVAWASRGLRTPARKALLAASVDSAYYGRAFGLERAMDTTGAILAPLLVVAFTAWGLGQRELIMWAVVPGLLATCCIVWLVREQPGRLPVRRPLVSSFSGLPSRYYRFLVGVGLFGLADFADTFYILYAIQVLEPSLGPAQASMVSFSLYALHNVAYALLAYAGGWLSDYLNRRFLLGVGYVSAAVAAALMAAQASSWWALVGLFALGGASVGLYEAIEDAIVADLVDDARRGAAYGGLALTTGLGDLISSVTVGWMWFRWGAPVAFTLAALLMLMGTAVVALTAYHDRNALSSAPEAE